jgi:5-methyltetrahydrofolate--homocysteine methyltransferase
MKGAHIVALNCGTGMEMSGAATVVEHYRKFCALPTMVQPNAGLPTLEKGKAVYKQLPEDMARGVPQVLQAGANIVGSCCGSTPEHTLAIRRIVDEFNLSTAKNPS